MPRLFLALQNHLCHDLSFYASQKGLFFFLLRLSKTKYPVLFMYAINFKIVEVGRLFCEHFLSGKISYLFT